MRVILITEDKLNELVEKCINDCFKSPDPTKMAESVNHQTVNYHVQVLKTAIREGKLGL